MKIVFLYEQYSPVIWDGGGTYTTDVARALAAIGHEVHVLCCKGARIRDELDAGVHVHRRPPLRIPLAKLPGALGRYFMDQRDSIGMRVALSASYACWLRALNLKPDVIETADGEGRALLAALWPDTALVIQLHTPTLLELRMRYGRLSAKGRLADALDRYSARRADAFSCMADPLVQRLRNDDWLPPNTDVTIIPPVFDATPYAGISDVEATASVVVAVGRLDWRKAPDVLLDALGTLKRRGIDAELVLAGKPSGEIDGQSWDRWIERRASRLGVRCRLTGFVAGAQLRELYNAARVVAIPSRFESYSMVGLEAMASGRPVVASASTGIARLLECTGAGTTVPAGDAASLADGLAPYLVSAQHAKAIGMAGRRALLDLEPIKIAKRREQLYQQAIDTHRVRRRGGHTDAENTISKIEPPRSEDLCRAVP